MKARLDQAWFTASAYPDVHKNLKLTVDEQVIPEEPVSSTGTLSSLQHLAKDFSFGDQFLNDKPSEADNEKTTADTEAESMASALFSKTLLSPLPITSPVIDLVSRPHSPNFIWPSTNHHNHNCSNNNNNSIHYHLSSTKVHQSRSHSARVELEQHIATGRKKSSSGITKNLLEKQGADPQVETRIDQHDPENN
ncbi:hypothetical protein Tco_0514372 [Tanacetum coccineum]